MGDRNQELLLRNLRPNAAGPIIEIGSRVFGNTVNYRTVYPDAEYVGVDLELGEGVDKIVDLEQGIGDLKSEYFEFGICCSALEHTPRPWVVAENICRLLRPGGSLFVSVPWVWRFHPHPDDFFRFSFRGVQSLFPEIAWQGIFYSTTVTGEIIQINVDTIDIDNRMAIVKKMESHEQRKYLPHLMVNAIGTKVSSPAQSAPN